MSKSNNFGDIRFTFMPYCIQKQDDGRYAILNRRYKPLGFSSTEFFTYADYPILVNIKGLTEKTASKLSHCADSNLNDIYLYNDGCIPTSSTKNMDDYLARLAVLAKLSIS